MRALAQKLNQLGLYFFPLVSQLAISPYIYSPTQIGQTITLQEIIQVFIHGDQRRVMPSFTVDLDGKGIQVGFQGIVNIAIVTINILARILIDQILSFIQAEGLLEEFHK